MPLNQPPNNNPHKNKMSKEVIKIDANTEIKVMRSSNGNVISEAPYVGGKKHGMETWWADDTQKWREEMWRKGKSHGLTTWWYRTK